MRTQMYNDSQPLVSVIIPTYNYAGFIGEAIESVRAQTYTHWECLVVDDGSTDNTAEIIAAYIGRDPRIQYLRQQNQYQAAARNRGLRQSKGQYVQFLDADDKIEPHKFERHVTYLEQHLDVDIVYSGVRFFDALDAQMFVTESDAPLKVPKVSGEGRDVLPNLVHANIMAVNSPLVRRSLVEAVGSFDEELSPAEDWDYWLRCAFAGARFRFVEDPGTLALVRMHPRSSSQNLERMYRAMVLVRNKLEGQLKDPKLRARNREGKSAEEGYLGVEMITAGKSLRGAGHILRAAALARPVRWRAKWFLCALAGPFVPGRLKAMIASPLAETFRGSAGQHST
jgi:glycosyltransferase involved in cell wall biosynthesis